MRTGRYFNKKVAAWTAVSISAIFANLWAFWGIIENFHEGWYHPNVWDNVSLMFAQYLLAPISFMVPGLISIRWNRAGGIIHAGIALLLYFKFGQMNAALLFIAVPLLVLAVLYWFGSFQYRTLAYALVCGLPLLIILFLGSLQLYRVSHRFNDHDFSARYIGGNGVDLIWAPAGAGWPDYGVGWEDAKKICAYLSEDGYTISHDSLNIWRLPTVEEAVASQVFRGTNAGGKWNHQTKEANYVQRPDKESPLWNVNLKTIYWWTSTEVDEYHAYIIVYNGGVFSRNKKTHVGYLNFRAVKDLKRNKFE